MGLCFMALGALALLAPTAWGEAPPEALDLFALDTPLAVFQGEEDAIVPPAQAEVIVAALRRKGVPHAYLLFPGEQHGFRRAENIRTALDTELAFYQQLL